MFARIALLAALALAAVAPASAEEFNLFVASSAAPICVEDWQMFQTQQAVADAGVDGWNVFAVAHTVEKSSGAKTNVLAAYSGSHVLMLTRANCGPCNVGKTEYVPKLKAAGWIVDEISFEDHPELFEALDADAAPTFIAVIDQVEQGRFVGADWEQLVAMLQRANAQHLARK